jgi:hypothetical protein
MFGEQIHQIEEHIECLDATGHEGLHQEMETTGLLQQLVGLPTSCKYGLHF